MIIAVSDVHLGEMGFQEQDKQFSNFLDHVQNTLLKEGGDLVLLGDIFDFWRRDSVEILEDYGDIIEKVKSFPSNINVHYIIGNHDYYMSEIPQYFNEMPFSSFGLSLRIKDVQTFRFIHGHQLEVMTNPYTKDMSLYLSLARRLSYHAGVTGQCCKRYMECAYFPDSARRKIYKFYVERSPVKIEWRKSRREKDSSPFQI